MNTNKITLFLDLETMGLAPSYAPILEIAAIVVSWTDGEPTLLDSFHQFINPLTRIPKAITNINGITNDSVKDCDTEMIVLRQFAQWITGNGYADAVPIAHNGKFDFRFLIGRSEKFFSLQQAHNLFVEMNSRLVDTLPIARSLIKKGYWITENNSAKQEALAHYCGFTYKAHSALEDVMALITIYKEMQKTEVL